jgi:hypothetical protein
MNTSYSKGYPIGQEGQPWGQEEKQQWFEMQSVKRSYAEEVLSRFSQCVATHDVFQYGALPIDPERYPLFAIRPQQHNPSLPDILVTGGVHGYETSGVHGAIDFACNDIKQYADKANIYILPCISPWAYETINRWGPNAVDPNRSFYSVSASHEAQLAMQCVANMNINPLMHIDLHETTDTDNSDFRPALAARDAVHQSVWQIPDGFYTVADTKKPQIAFQQAIIEQVKKVTHIAPADENNAIIGVKISSEGVIDYDKSALHLCGRMTNAEYVSTTEVYPDSPLTHAQECNLAQVTAVKAAIDFVLKGEK